MACDMFSPAEAKELLNQKSILFLGDSNVRAIYKDLLWLLENGTLIPQSRLRSKNEESHCNDIRLSEGILHSGRNYREARIYKADSCISFHFTTKLYSPNFVDAVMNLNFVPDVIVFNSCLWDLTRWGSNGVAGFKQNLTKSFTFLKEKFPSTHIIWLTSLPPSFTSYGGFFTKEIQFMRNMLPWHILFANQYSSDIAKSFKIDILDLHYSFRFLLNYHVKDGIHWNSTAVRYSVNLLLTHLALVFNYKLPGKFMLDKVYLEQNIMNSDYNAKVDQSTHNQRSYNRRKRNRNKRNRKHATARPKCLPNRENKENISAMDFPCHNFQNNFDENVIQGFRGNFSNEMRFRF